MYKVHKVGEGWQECDCSCHDGPEVGQVSAAFIPAIHAVVCCSTCGMCGKRIVGNIQAHRAQCSRELIEATPG